MSVIDETKDTIDRFTQELKKAMFEAQNIMSKSQYKKCSLWIHVPSAFNAVTGMVPLPVVDAVPISAAQIGMVVKLASIFGLKITRAAADGAIRAAAATLVGRTTIKLIPGAGWVVSGAVAGIATETIGWLTAIEFAKEANPKNKSKESNDSESQAEKEEYNTQQSLTERAAPFLSGEKSVKEHKAEYDQLREDVRKAIDLIDEDDPQRNIYVQLYVALNKLSLC